MGDNKKIVERRVYGLTDFMNQVGGLYSFIIVILEFILPYFQVNTLSKTLIKHFYQTQESPTPPSPGPSVFEALLAFKSRKKIKVKTETAFQELLRTMLEWCCRRQRPQS